MQTKNAITMSTICLILMPISVFGYLSALKEPYFSDAFLRDVVDRMGKDFIDTADSYIDPMPLNDMPSRLALMARASKDMEAEQMDYDALLDGNPSPSLRDQEYLQHSSLWGHQYMSGGGGEGPHTLKSQIKTDATLPAYCNPPNPCPVGYNQQQGCQMDFENTAAFSREYQAAQECMCDGEHMFECPGQEQEGGSRQMKSELESFLAQQFRGGEHKNLVAKKFQPHHARHESPNPYLEGEKLPIAAKKGTHVN